MPLQAEDSVIADSTLSTSPSRDQQPSPQPEIKRAARTYGRKKSPRPQLDASFSSAASASPPPPSYSSILHTAPPNLKENVPGTSDNEDGSESDSPPTSRAGRGIMGDWRKELARIDQKFDDDDDQPTTSTAGLETTAPASKDATFDFGRSNFLLDGDDESSKSPEPPKDIFGEPADRSSPRKLGQSVSPGSPLERGPRQRHRKAGRGVVQDSDSEAESVPGTSFAHSSPSASVPLTPSRPHTSETPPTSDLSMPPSKGSRSGKGRARSVRPLEFEQVSASADEGSKKPRKRKPSKKETEELYKEQAKLAMDRKAQVQRPQQNTARFSKAGFFSILPTTSDTSTTLPSEDITLFTSSSERELLTPPGSPKAPKAPTLSPTTTAGPSRTSAPVVPAQSHSDSDSDNGGLLLSKPSKQKAPSKEQLNKKKLEYIAKQAKAQQALAQQSDEDDELEIVDAKKPSAAAENLEKAHSNASKPMNHSRKLHMTLAGVRPNKGQGSKAEKETSTMDRERLDKQIWGKAQQTANTITKQKEEEWRSFGGQLKQHDQPTEDSQEVLRKLAERGLEAAKANAEREARLQDSEDDSDDGDWNPEERGSASPEPTAMDEDTEGHNAADEDVTMADEEDEDGQEDEENDENVRIRLGRRLVVGSDDENDENVPVRNRPRRVLSDDEDMAAPQHRRSPSTDDLTGTDKENEDKENSKGVVRFDSFTSDDMNLSLDLSGPRRPFQEISSLEDTPKPFEIGRSNLTQLFEAQLSGVRRTPEATPGPSLRPALGDFVAGGDGFSQFSQGDRTLLGRSGSSHGDLSDLFDATTQKLNDNAWSPKAGSLLGEAFVEKPLVGQRLQKPLVLDDPLALTQDVKAIKPVRLAGTQARKADAIFEKDQELVLGDSFEPKSHKDKLYINEDGFLTQTRPNVEDPEVYEFPTPTQMKKQSTSTPFTVGITPGSLQSTGLSLKDSSPAAESPLIGRRLHRKRSQSPSERPAKRNAYEVLNGNPKEAERKKRRKLDAREFVVGEAEESDDEGGLWGKRTGPKDDEEEEDGEDQDRNLESLVDDHEMDDETLAEDLVREKFKEAEAEADKKIEEEAQAIVEGRRRKRRRNGDLMSEGSEDEEDNENQRARARMSKAYKKRGDVEALENNPVTKAFAEVYKSTTADDDDEFAHLANDDTQAILGSLTGGDGDDEDEDEEQELVDSDDETQGAMDISVFDRKVRERIANHAGHSSDVEDDGLDPHDTAWVEDDDEGPMIAVKTIKSVAQRAIRAPRNGLDPSTLDDGFEDGNPMSTRQGQGDARHQQQGQMWAKREGRNRNTTTGRSVGAAAVTGLARAKTGGGSLRQMGSASTAGAGDKAKPTVVKKAESLLISKLGDKSSRFTS